MMMWVMVIVMHWVQVLYTVKNTHTNYLQNIMHDFGLVRKCFDEPWFFFFFFFLAKYRYFPILNFLLYSIFE